MEESATERGSKEPTPNRLTWSKVLNAVIQAIIAAITALTAASCANLLS